MTTKMSKMEEHKWMTYFIWAVIIAIFGMVIYMVTMDEKKNDRYYVSVIFHSGDDVPLFPVDTGTLEGGVGRVRDAVANLVSATADVNFSVPHVSNWHLNAVPEVATGSSAPSGYHYFYSFPVSHTDFGDAGKLAEDVLGGLTVTDLFDYDADDLTWATDVFTPGNISLNLTYGTRDSVALANITG